MAHRQAFQPSAFQDNAFQVTQITITSSTILHKPVDYALAGDQNDKDNARHRGLPIRTGRLGKTMVRHTFNE